MISSLLYFNLYQFDYADLSSILMKNLNRNIDDIRIVKAHISLIEDEVQNRKLMKALEYEGLMQILEELFLTEQDPDTYDSLENILGNLA